MAIKRLFIALNSILNNLDLIDGIRRGDEEIYIYINDKKLKRAKFDRDLNFKIVPSSRIKNCRNEVFVLGGFKEEEYKDIYLA